jgi:AraC family transcriptional regulator, regulatory protein of adaptative response / methylated-DNA-[protein]-cysteine methyltransferase
MNANHYDTVAAAIRYLQSHVQAQPSLDDVAAAVGMSPFHLQRVFSEWAGISPKRFLQVLTRDYARERLAQQGDVLGVSLDAGLSSPSRLHDLMVSCEAMTPGEIRAAASGLTVGYGAGTSPFGEMLLAWTSRGLCHAAFVDDAATARTALHARWPGAQWQHDDAVAAQWLAQIFPKTPTPGTVHLVLRGTNFQVQVWQALLNIAPGELISYGQLAQSLGRPGGARAVGNAVAANELAYLIPCHRVIRESGESHHYRWGPARKRALIGWEGARFVV